jgi:hypothetical protein
MIGRKTHYYCGFWATTIVADTEEEEGKDNDDDEKKKKEKKNKWGVAMVRVHHGRGTRSKNKEQDYHH